MASRAGGRSGRLQDRSLLSKPERIDRVARSGLAATMCAEGGQLQLNAFEPTISYCVLSSLRVLTAAIQMLTKRCVIDIEADREHCLELVENSIGLVTALGPALGVRGLLPDSEAGAGGKAAGN